MKKVAAIILVFFSLFFIGCTQKSVQAVSDKLDLAVASELEQIEGVNNFNEETIKALSVIIRTKLSKENLNDCEYSNNNTHILKLVTATNGEVLYSDDNIADVDYALNSSSKWQMQIKKSDILSYLNKNNISLSNISNIEPVYNNESELSYLKIGGKQISYDELKQNFNLPSPKITSIENNLTTITVFGETNQKNIFVISTAESLANEYSYKQLLNNFYNDFDIKTI